MYTIICYNKRVKSTLVPALHKTQRKSGVWRDGGSAPRVINFDTR